MIMWCLFATYFLWLDLVFLFHVIWISPFSSSIGFVFGLSNQNHPYMSSWLSYAFICAWIDIDHHSWIFACLNSHTTPWYLYDIFYTLIYVNVSKCQKILKLPKIVLMSFIEICTNLTHEKAINSTIIVRGPLEKRKVNDYETSMLLKGALWPTML